MRHVFALRRYGLGLILAALAAFPCLPAQAQQAPQGQPARPDFNTVVKDMQAMPGLVTLYRERPEDPTKDHSRLLALIPRGLMNQDLLLASTISRGEMAGYEWDDFLVRFELQDTKRVLISVPDVRYVRTPGNPAAEVVDRTHTPEFLAALPVVTMSPQGDPLVDLGSSLTGALVPLPPPYIPQMMGALGLMPRKDLCRFTKIKAFPENIVVDVDLVFSDRNGGGQSMGISYALRRLPDLGHYHPRAADERVGYFITARQDWGMKHSERENIIRYINRWDMKKKDPTLEISPPEKPIVFIIEKTVPFQWRKYIAEGINEWNKAFEKIGISGAVVAEQQTDDNEFAHVDPEDARYNFIRWIATGTPFAMGPSRVDPRTGQILNALIIFDDSFLRAIHGDFEILSPRPLSAVGGSELPKFLEANPSFMPLGMTLQQVRQAGGTGPSPLSLDAKLRHVNDGTVAGALAERFGHNGVGDNCGCAFGLQDELAMANMVSGAAGKKIPERLIGEVVRWVTSHEVGHTLGLRHNFKASSWLSLDEIKRRRDNTDDPTVASVMDYNPTLFFAGDDVEKVRHFITPDIGPYDYWAIEYGYRIPTQQDGDENHMLAKIASQCTQREHAYGSDEDADTNVLTAPDPLVNTYDMGDDPIAWAKERVKLCDSLMKDVRKWAVKDGQPKYYLRMAYTRLLTEKARNMVYVSRLVGGEYVHRNRPGDPGAPPAIELVQPKRQRDAMKMLSESLFSDDFFSADPALLNDLVPSRWLDWADASFAARVDFASHESISRLQSLVLLKLCSPTVLQRVYDAELKTNADDKFTAAELIKDVRDSVWSDLKVAEDAHHTDAKPMLSSVRRNLQRQHLHYMLASADSTPGALMSPDLQSMVRFSLRDLSDQIGNTLKTGGDRIDFATRAHLTECKAQIDRVLNPQHIKAGAD